MTSKNPKEPKNLNIIIKGTDMSPELKSDAEKIFYDLYERSVNEKEMAQMIKRDFDKKHLSGWHCIVGKSFSSYVTHEEGSFI
jgi:dynein light chain LC8-type